jgi:hypothetical protein
MRPGTAIAERLIGGASGAGCMMVLRMAARRAGWVDLTPHQATKDWLVERAGRTWQETAVNVAAHLTYGVATTLVSGELGRQTQGPRGALGRLRARVG